MNRTLHRSLTAGAIALAAFSAACSESRMTAPAASVASLGSALTIALAGNDQSQTSYVGTPSETSGRGWSTDDSVHDGHGFMGGGLGDHFLGDDFSAGHRRGRFGEDDLSGACAFSAASGRVECAAVTHHGLTIVRSASYQDAAGAVQQAPDTATTNTINTRTTVSGTVSFDGRHGHHDDGPNHHTSPDDDNVRRSDTTTVALSSERTVSGLASGSRARTVNAKSAGTETTKGTDTTGHFTVVRVAGDTITGLVIPVGATGGSYPTAGTIVRAMHATLAYDGGAPTTTTRREVITFDGTSVAKMTITQNGSTKSCTIALPHGRPACQ